MIQTRVLLKAALFFGAAFVLTIAGYAQSSREEAYQKHVERVRGLLPPHSALPPVLDLSKPNSQTKGASQAFERKFTGSMQAREITDPGIGPSVGRGSVSTTTIEYGTPVWALPARSCEAVIVGTPVSATVHLAYTHRFVYSTFSVDVSEVLKGSSTHGIRKGEKITALERGGTLRFPSGHVETFLWIGEGFMQTGKQYLLFIWRPIRSDPTYMVADAYLIQGGLTFPIDTVGGGESAYAGMPFGKFEAKVKMAIAKNIDTN